MSGAARRGSAGTARNTRPGSPAARRQQGFTLTAVVAATLLLALATERVMGVVSHEAQRQREAQLLRQGAAHADAIRSYYLATPGAVKRWPGTLADLVEDKRFVQVRRHLREAYGDPVTRGGWELLPAPDGGIAGVRSTSTRRPLQTAAVQAGELSLAAAQRYSDWQFVPRLPPPEAAARVRPGGPP